MKSGGNLQDLETIWFYNGDVQGRTCFHASMDRIQVRLYFQSRIKIDLRF